MQRQIEVVMILKSKFKPAWWLKNRHLQTILPRVYPKPVDFQPLEEVFELTDGDFLEITYTESIDANDNNKPIVIVLHGLEGSFESFYAKGMMNEMFNQGWTGVLMHFRGCGKQTNRKAHSYHSGQTQDLTEFVKQLSEKAGSRPIYAIGFSLGGNVLTKYLGETEQSLLTAGVVISAPLSLKVCADTMASGFSKVYQKYLVDKLKDSTTKKLKHLHHQQQMNVDIPAINNIKRLQQFDELVTAPLHGFKNALDYYQKCSGKQFLKSINIPTLVIHAKDDPFMTPAVIPSAQEVSNTVQFEVSDRGGHVGFLSGNNPFKPVFWLEQRCSEFIQHIEKLRAK